MSLNPQFHRNFRRNANEFDANFSISLFLVFGFATKKFENFCNWLRQFADNLRRRRRLDCGSKRQREEETSVTIFGVWKKVYFSVLCAKAIVLESWLHPISYSAHTSQAKQAKQSASWDNKIILAPETLSSLISFLLLLRFKEGGGKREGKMRRQK